MNKHTKTVSRRECSTLAMSCGGEKTHPRVVYGGLVRNWVGFGWVIEGKATAADKRKYPVLVD